MKFSRWNANKRLTCSSLTPLTSSEHFILPRPDINSWHQSTQNNGDRMRYRLEWTNSKGEEFLRKYLCHLGVDESYKFTRYLYFRNSIQCLDFLLHIIPKLWNLFVISWKKWFCFILLHESLENNQVNSLIPLKVDVIIITCTYFHYYYTIKTLFSTFREDVHKYVYSSRHGGSWRRLF